MKKVIEIHSDGACSNNQGEISPGGWAAILVAKDEAGKIVTRKEVTGGHPNTSNQKMELMAAIGGLKALTSPGTEVTLFTDSKYVVDGMTEWIHNLNKKGWKGSNKKPVKNRDLWEELDAVASQHSVTWNWVKGHNGDPLNEEADDLAVVACEDYKGTGLVKAAEVLRTSDNGLAITDIMNIRDEELLDMLINLCKDGDFSKGTFADDTVLLQQLRYEAKSRMEK